MLVIHSNEKANYMIEVTRQNIVASSACMQDKGCVCLVDRLELTVLNFFNTLIFFSCREKRLESQECKSKQEELDLTADLLSCEM